NFICFIPHDLINIYNYMHGASFFYKHSLLKIPMNLFICLLFFQLASWGSNRLNLARLTNKAITKEDRDTQPTDEEVEVAIAAN
ncbi:hypothetical protein ACJX0J_017788, partial [Zea mays]